MRTLKLVGAAMLVVLVGTSPLLAEDKGAASFYGTAAAAGFGAALTIVGAAWGFGRIGAAALESMARQPEKAGDIRGAMIVIAALLEGATFFSLIVCIIMALKS